MTIWPGYATTILAYESSIMMCTDISHKVLRSETVLDFMVTLRQQCSSQHFPEICTKELVGLIVLTKQVVSLSGTRNRLRCVDLTLRYQRESPCLVQTFRYNNKTYRIDDIAWDHTPNNTFKRGDTDISFKNYYKTVSRHSSYYTC